MPTTDWPGEQVALMLIALCGLVACSPAATIPSPQITERAPVGTPNANNSATSMITSIPQTNTASQATPLSVSATLEPTNPPVSSPAAPPTTQPTALVQASVRAYEGTLTLPVYPYARFLDWSVDATTGVRFATFDRAAYERSAPTPRAQTYKAVYLENELLLLTFLPELGGRLYQAVYKPSNQTIFYHNPVIKPSRFGPFEPDKNWWLAAGGMEWALPVQEHGYEWGVPWSYRLQGDRELVSISLTDSDAPDRLQTEITVTLRRGAADWTITPQWRNATARPMRVQFWLNAMLTLGSATMAADTEFNLPTNAVRVHSTGDKRLPGERQTIPWPNYQGVDYSRYNNWQNWLGVFVNALNGDSLSTYNHQTQLGIRRSFPASRVPGVKLFAFGPQFPDRSYTDDDSQYFELWGGPNKSFWPEDDITLAPGSTLSWSETWTVYK